MYAIVKIKNQQYKVETDNVLQVPLMEEEAGSSLTFEEVLLFSDGEDVRVGTPLVDGCKVKAEVVGHGVGPKLLVFKKKKRDNYRRHTGHRQQYTEIVIKEIAAS